MLRHEQTREVVGQRRSRTLLQLSEEIPRARNTDTYWTLATEVLSRNDKDIPFALLYSAEADGPGSESSRTRFSDNHSQHCTLRGSFGLPENSPAGPKYLDFQHEYVTSMYELHMRHRLTSYTNVKPRVHAILSTSPYGPKANLIAVRSRPSRCCVGTGHRLARLWGSMYVTSMYEVHVRQMLISYTNI
jgi:hypothetical protein